VHRARFIVLSVGNRSSTYGSDEHDPTISWLLVSPNNRPLGRGCTTFDTYEACREAVHRLREWVTRATSTVAVADANRQWGWRVELDGAPIAVSTRTYLRQRECDYNLKRFMDAIPSAELASAVRVIANGPKRRVGPL